MGYIFVSYSRNDKEFVGRLIADLKDRNHNVWYDESIMPGESWADTLTNAVEGAEFILVVLSKNYSKSNWSLKELEIGMLRESEKKAIVIPLLIEQCKPPLILGNKSIINFTDYESGFQQLSKTLKSINAEIETKLAESDAIEQSEVPTIGSENQISISNGTITHFNINIEPYQIERLRQDIEAFKRKSPQTDDVEESKTKKDREIKCFIVMPFSVEALNVVYEDFVKPVLENDCGLFCERGDDVFGSNVIMDDILTSIRNSDLIVADLTGKNANVFYEVGICHALDKKVLLLAQSMDDVPFDLRHRRVLLYEYSPRGCKRLEKVLKDNIQAML